MNATMPDRNFDMRTVLCTVVVALAGLWLLVVPALAVEGTVEGGRINPLPIAISPFLAGDGAEEASATIGEVITNNLGRSGYFNPLDPASFIEKISNFEQEP